MNPFLMSKKGNLLALVLLFSSATAMAQTSKPAELTALHSAYTNAMAQIDGRAQQRKSAELTRHGEKLNNILTFLRNNGDLDGYKSVQQESQRFAIEKTLPARATQTNVVLAVAITHKNIAEIDTDTKRQEIALLTKYVSVLVDLRKRLMLANKMSDAEVINDEIKAQEAVLASMQSEPPAKTSDKNLPTDIAHGKEVKPVQTIGNASGKSKEYDIRADDKEGQSLGNLKKGDKIIIEYVEGEWSSGRRGSPLSPDTDSNAMTTSIYVKDGDRATRMIVEVPMATKGKPFEFVVADDAEYYLHARDRSSVYVRNSGVVRYKVTVAKGK